MQILILGANSFAANGAAERLSAAGHKVIRFTRGKTSVSGDLVQGPVNQLAGNPHLPEKLDAVINYVILKDRSPENNVAFLRTLVAFCLGRSVKHLIHFSSISSYVANEKLVVEDSPIEKRPDRKGSYGSLKAATDLFMEREFPRSIKLTLLRPGFILGPGLLDPIVGTAIRIPSNRLLIIGNAGSTMPITTRELVNNALATIVEQPPAGDREVVMLVDPRSPTRHEYIQYCAQSLGAGTGATEFPWPLWWLAAVGGEATARLLGQKKLGVYHKLSARIAAQTYNPEKSAKRLSLNLGVDWKAEIRRSLEGQTPNFAVPAPLPELTAPPQKAVNYIGWGRIVAQKHLPALRRLHFSGKIEGYDVAPVQPPLGITVHPLAEATPASADLHVVATPGLIHGEAIGLLAATPGAVLVEKPLCYSEKELTEWLSFAAARSQPVAVCHNYRFKSNVLALYDVLREFNPGRLLHAFVEFSSPPVAADSASWARNERSSRTLLMDYGIHFIDIACMFWPGGWQPQNVAYTTDARGHTQKITGSLDSAGDGGYRVDLLLRQGFAPRRARVSYTFQNYVAALDFFPDTFSYTMAGDTARALREHARAVAKATRRKILDKLTNRDADRSHDRILSAMLAPSPGVSAGIEVGSLKNFYRAIFSVAESVYGE